MGPSRCSHPLIPSLWSSRCRRGQDSDQDRRARRRPDSNREESARVGPPAWVVRRPHRTRSAGVRSADRGRHSRFSGACLHRTPSFFSFRGRAMAVLVADRPPLLLRAGEQTMFDRGCLEPRAGLRPARLRRPQCDPVDARRGRGAGLSPRWDSSLAIRGRTGPMALQVMTTLPTLAGIGAGGGLDAAPLAAAGERRPRRPDHRDPAGDPAPSLGRGGLRHRRDRRDQPSPPPQYHRPEWQVDRQARRIVQPVRRDDQPDRQPRRGPGRRHGLADPPQEAAAAGGDRRRDRPVHGVRLRIHRLDDVPEAAGGPAARGARAAWRGRDRPALRGPQRRDEAARVPGHRRG